MRDTEEAGVLSQAQWPRFMMSVVWNAETGDSRPRPALAEHQVPDQPGNTVSSHLTRNK